MEKEKGKIKTGTRRQIHNLRFSIKPYICNKPAFNSNMSRPESTNRHKTTAYILLALLLATSCSVQQRNTTPQQSNPSKPIENTGQQQSSPIRVDSPTSIATAPSEPLPQDTANAQTKDVEKKLGITIQRNDPAMPLYIEATKWLGVRYKYGGMGQSGVDCSGLTNLLYKAVYNKTLQRSSSAIARYDVKDIAKSELQPGDLVFFATSGSSKVTHVGVYLKDNRFIHASSIAGVVVNNLNEDYYRKTFVKCGRVE